jgi:hypothetical protein
MAILNDELQNRLRAMRAAFGRAGIKLSAPTVEGHSLRLTIAQDLQKGRLLSSQELENRLRGPLEALQCFQDSSLDLQIKALPADRWEVGVDQVGIFIRRLVPPFQEGCILPGTGETTLLLGEYGEFHMVTDSDISDSKKRSMAKVLRNRIYDQKLFHALPK